MADKYFIYLVFNSKSEKVYVGKTFQLGRRFKDHIRSGLRPKSHFSKAIRKYGEDSFTWVVLTSCASNDEAIKLEQGYIEEYAAFGPLGYNSTRGGHGTDGYSHSPETKDKIRMRAMGRKRSLSSRLKQSRSARGSKRSPETCAKITQMWRKHRAVPILAWHYTNPCLITRYDAIADFCRATGAPSGNVTKCLDGGTNRVRGYFLMRAK